ncbi:MAG: flagellar protein FlgJ [Motiliproteus sp.]|jgi:flagellar protein FlgJ
MSNDLSIKSYTDLNELNKLKKAGRDDAPDALAAVAEQFESLFLNMLLKNMRKANEGLSEGGLFDSSESKFYQDMMDQQLSLTLSSGSGIGLRDVLIRQLSQGSEPQQVDAEQAIQRQPLDQASAGLTQLLEQSAALAVQASIKKAAEAQTQTQAQTPVTASGNPVAALMTEGFDTPEAFIQQLLPVAERIAVRAGVAPEMLVAQAALETGWGKHLPRHGDGGSSHNLFGIKADQRWEGERVTTSTLEFRDGLAQREKATFRAYGSYEQSMQDYVEFLSQSPRYQGALEQAHDARSYTQQLQLAGYATDPDYSNKIMGILDGDLLQNALGNLSGR